MLIKEVDLHSKLCKERGRQGKKVPTNALEKATSVEREYILS